MSQSTATPLKKINMQSSVSYAQVASLSSGSSGRPLQPAIVRQEQGKVHQSQRGEPLGPIARPTAQTSPQTSAEDVLRLDREGRELELPDFSSLSIHDRASPTGYPTTSSSREQEDSFYDRLSPSVQYGSPQTPPSASSYSIRTPHTGLHHSPTHVAASKPMYGQHPYGSPHVWSYGPEDGPMAVTPPVSYMTPEKIGRFLLISDVPSNVDEDSLCDVLKGLAVFKALIATFKESGGFFIVVFFDPREAIKVYNHLRIKPVRFQGEADNAILHCRPISKTEVKVSVRGYPDAERVFENTESKILVEIFQGRPVAKETIQGYLEQLGQVMTIDSVGTPGYAYKAEFFDTRKAAQAILQLNGLAAAGGRLKVLYDIAAPGSPYTLGSAAYRSNLFASTISTPQRSPTEPTDADVFGPTSRRMIERPAPMTQQQSQTPGSQTTTFRKHMSQPLQFTPSAREEDPYRKYSLPATPLHLTAMGRRLSEPGMLASLASQADISARIRNGQGIGGIPRSPSQAIPEQNRVFPERVSAHLDSRTSVMVKDVPNKLSRQGLIDILNEVVPGEFDFVYLRFDFNNCCNVGYAFVNFVSTDALYHFIQTKVGKRWNLFSSDKVLQISYANIQGKQNLINKFKNSAVMGVMEQWRPQIFYSDGAKKGLPEPFPSADNTNVMRRSHDPRLSLKASAAHVDEHNNHGVYRYDDEFDTSSFDAHYKF